jgi:hypothetical protein
MHVAASSFALCEVVFEVRIRAGDLGHRIQLFLAHRHSAQVRVDDHPGGVDHSNEAHAGFLEL